MKTIPDFIRSRLVLVLIAVVAVSLESSPAHKYSVRRVQTRENVDALKNINKPLFELDRLELSRVMGADTSDLGPGSGGEKPGWCFTAYEACLARCTPTPSIAGMVMVFGMAYPVSRTYYLAFVGGCMWGCHIGFSNCG
jgi:hypothetical protein